MYKHRSVTPAAVTSDYVAKGRFHLIPGVCVAKGRLRGAGGGSGGRRGGVADVV